MDRIFNHPLECILDPSLSDKEPLVPRGSEDWLYPEEFHVSAISLDEVAFFVYFFFFAMTQNVTDQIIKIDETETVLYRHHRLRSCASAVKGLTADILVSSSDREHVPVAVANAPS